VNHDNVIGNEGGEPFSSTSAALIASSHACRIASIDEEVESSSGFGMVPMITS